MTHIRRADIKACMTIIRFIILVLFVATFSVARPVLASHSDDAMSGLATNALIRAFEVSGLDDKSPPPFRLQPYVVTIRASGSSFEVFFLNQTEARAIPVVVAARSSQVVWKEGAPIDGATVPTLPAGYVLPGIIAGEIITAYRQALSDGFDRLRTGAYNVWYLPRAGASTIGFASLDQPPTEVSTEPTATRTPRPGSKCFSVGRTGPDYSVSVQNGTVNVYRIYYGCP